MSKSNPLGIRLIDNNYLVRRRSLEAHRKFSKKYARGRLLDIGCGEKPMKAFFADTVSEHIGLDHERSIHGLDNVDVIGTAYDTKQPDCSFDTVLCTTVFEHLEEPEKALREAFRVLKPGGYAIYSVPLFWHLHEEPRDFYRYTKHGLRYLFEKVGFEITVLHPCGGFWVTWGSMLNYYLKAYARGPFKYIVNAIKILNNLICLKFDHWHKVEKFTWMYIVITQKPESEIE